MAIDMTTGGSIDEGLWRAHSVELVRYATLLVGPHDAPDIVSSAFMRTAPHLRETRIEARRAYLFRAVTNAAHDHRRRQLNRWRRDLLAVANEAATATDNEIDIRRAVAELSVRQRAVIYLSVWEDMSERAIADYLDVSVGTVRRHLVRARSRLRRTLA